MIGIEFHPWDGKRWFMSTRLKETSVEHEDGVNRHWFRCPFHDDGHLAYSKVLSYGAPSILTCVICGKQGMVTWGFGDNNEDAYESSFWKGLHKWKGRKLKARYSPREAFRMWSEQGCPVWMLEDLTDHKELNRLIESHKETSGKTNSKKVYA
jgi:hypothetical protein